MEMSYGKHAGKQVAWILLKLPNYANWLLREAHPSVEVEFMAALVHRFDELPYTKQCCCSDCNNIATRLILYNGLYTGEYWFCDECDPYSKGASKSAKLTSVSSIWVAMNMQESSLLVNKLSKAKGAPERKTAKALARFFHYRENDAT